MKAVRQTFGSHGCKFTRITAERGRCNARNNKGLQRYLKQRGINPYKPGSVITRSVRQTISILTSSELGLFVQPRGDIMHDDTCSIEVTLRARVRQVVDEMAWAADLAIVEAIDENAGKSGLASLTCYRGH